MLSQWGVKFEAIDIELNPTALEELKHRGILQIPAIIEGYRVFHGWDPKGLAAFLGVDYDESERLSPDELTERFRRILTAAEDAIRQVPDKHIGMMAPGRNRTVRDLGYHIFRLSLVSRN